MRLVTKKAVRAFLNRNPMRSGNMRVYNEDGETRMLLHRNRIACMDVRGVVSISTCGWDTRTTLDRLNGLMRQLNVGGVCTRNLELQMNGASWDGKWTVIYDPAARWAEVYAPSAAQAACYAAREVVLVAKAARCVHGAAAGTCKSEICDGTY